MRTIWMPLLALASVAVLPATAQQPADSTREDRCECPPWRIRTPPGGFDYKIGLPRVRIELGQRTERWEDWLDERRRMPRLDWEPRPAPRIRMAIPGVDFNFRIPKLGRLRDFDGRGALRFRWYSRYVPI